MTNRIAITLGEPAGIGPDLCIKIAQRPPANCELVAIADPALLMERASQLSLPLKLKPFDSLKEASPTSVGELTIDPVTLRTPVIPGSLNVKNVDYVLDSLRHAADKVLAGEFNALVTGPVQKSVINDAGIEFTGHTEFLAEHFHESLTVMMLATEGLRVALVTTHLPLAEVPGAISKELLADIITILNADLQQKFGLTNPKILVCGLNPHAGEGGHLGREEIEIIEPVIAEKRLEGINVVGPLPADTLFTEKYLADADAVLSMFHDQGLPVLKYKGFGNSSNITLGLPIIRTSVDHGTALDLAGSGKVNTGSMYNAIATALEMSKHWSP